MHERKTHLAPRESEVYVRVSGSTLRRLEHQGLIVPYRAPGGHRRYAFDVLSVYPASTRVWSSLVTHTLV
jgi:hypothetical protein